ncbi:uncharacterized protein UTRI_04793 [Ustilago trichophora]|uniref:Uncharacterized protein n=1 Tax=Ustilago trichophora TaxID=86804 RepID=A0A5C3EFI7_9BASI|nr:uncharacterized protein UTRI_04793 [Ustilago trichophora]
MSESSFRGLTPVTAPESIFSSSHSRKLRLRIISRIPSLPGLQFLAPFDPSNNDCFGALQRFVYSHLLSRSKISGVMEASRWERLRFWMDGFEVPFDDADIVRDGDVLEVQLGEEAGLGGETVEDEEDDVEYDDAEGSEDQEQEDEEVPLEQDAQNADERDAILQATRVAALLRAGIHTTSDNDDALPTSTLYSAPEDDLPRMSTLAPKSAKPASSKAPLPSTKGPTLPMPMPMMPMPPIGGIGSGASAAMAAFEAKRKQMQLNTATSSRKGSMPQIVATTRASALTKSVADHKKRGRDSSPSSSSSSDTTGSSSSSGSDTESDSDSSSSSSSSGDDDDASSSSNPSASSSQSDSNTDSDSESSDSAPSIQHTKTDRHHHTFPNPDSDSQTTNLVPPGSGTSRTKRRNQMRRKKQQLLREQNSHSHALSQIGDTAGVEEDAGCSWVIDREPMYRIKGVGSAFTNAKGVDGVESLPPGGGSFGLMATVDAGKSNKRKRIDEQESPDIPVQLERQRNPTLADSSPGIPPYGGIVPEGMTIRHVDCQSFYEGELERLEGEVLGDGRGDGDDDGYEGGYRGLEKEVAEKQRRAKVKGEDQANRAVNGVEELDYGPPHEANEVSGPRKKLKMEAVNPPPPRPTSSSPPPSSRNNPSSSSSSSTPHFHTWYATLPKPTFFTNPSNLSLYQPIKSIHLQPNQIITWSELTLHPLHRFPAMMPFIGLIRSRHHVPSFSVQLGKIGPLLQHNQDERDWKAFQVQEVVWDAKNGCPDGIFLVK